MVLINDEQKTLGMLVHLMAIFSSFIGPLILFLISKDKKNQFFVKENSKTALNFTISISLYYIVLFIITIPLIFVIVGLFLIPLFWVIGIFALVMEIIACTKAYNGEIYKYPLAIPFIK